MPLSPAKPRRHLHTRKIQCDGFRRDDGLWEIEAHMTDVKTYSFPNRDRGEVAAGEPVHEMWLRIAFDDEMIIREVEAVTDYSPFNICPSIAPMFKKLEGVKIGPGWNRQIKQTVGGVKGCTHLVELLKPIATTAFQLFFGSKRYYDEQAGKQAPQVWQQKPVLLNTCHAYAEDSEVVRDFFPQFYKAEKQDSE